MLVSGALSPGAAPCHCADQPGTLTSLTPEIRSIPKSDQGYSFPPSSSPGHCHLSLDSSGFPKSLCLHALILQHSLHTSATEIYVKCKFNCYTPFVSAPPTLNTQVKPRSLKPFPSCDEKGHICYQGLGQSRPHGPLQSGCSEVVSVNLSRLTLILPLVLSLGNTHLIQLLHLVSEMAQCSL